MISHDHNFKNIFLDFPKEALEWILPDIPAKMGKIRHVGFVRQEPGKRRLTDVYAGVREDEREAIFREIPEQEDTAMLAQYIKDKGFQEGKLGADSIQVVLTE
jgi:hypothetical protein